MKYIIAYYYYRLYRYFSNGGMIPLFSTFSVMFFFAYFNIVTFITFISLFNSIEKIKMPVFEGANILYPFLIILILGGLFYRFMTREGHHDIILSKFSTETSKQKIVSSLLVCTYFIISISLFILALWLRQNLKGY
jgi:hypothetical protein